VTRPSSPFSLKDEDIVFDLVVGVHPVMSSGICLSAVIPESASMTFHEEKGVMGTDTFSAIIPSPCRDYT